MTTVAWVTHHVPREIAGRWALPGAVGGAEMTDAAMTEMSGIDFISQIRSSPDPLVAQTAVLMISGMGGEAIRRRALNAGADDFMEKPISASALIAAIGANVARRRRLLP